MVQAISRDVRALTSTYSHEDRAMIFCRSHDAVKKLAEALGLPAYTSRTAETNVHTMKVWLDGRENVMVCTSILGCGLDYPSVRDVIHLDVAHSMLDQHQQESRGGRDGRPCNATTYVPLG